MTENNMNLLQEMINDRRKDVQREMDLASTHHEEVEMMDAMMAEMSSLACENASLAREKRELEHTVDKQEAQLNALRDDINQLKLRIAAQNLHIGELEVIGKKVAAKTEHDELVKVFRTLIRNAKRKRMEKRVQVKGILLECVMSMHIELPDDLSMELNALDDEEPQELKVVNNFNGPVNQLINNVEQLTPKTQS